MQPRLTPSPSRCGRSSTNLLACRPLPPLVNLNDVATRLLAAASGRRGTSSGSAGGWKLDACGPHCDQRRGVRGDLSHAAARQRQLREQDQRSRRALRLAGAARGRSAQGPARSRRELQRRDPAAGVGRRLRAHPGRLSAVREAQGPPGQHARPIHPRLAGGLHVRLALAVLGVPPLAVRVQERPWASCAPAKIGRKRQNFGDCRPQRRHRRYAALRHVVDGNSSGDRRSRATVAKVRATTA